MLLGLLLCLTALTVPVPASAAEQIWPTFRQGLVLKYPVSEDVNKYVRHYTRNKLHIERTTQRAQPFLYYIAQQARRRGMPMEVALIPMVESAFDPYAHSSETAAGIWQFMPVTADRFNIDRTWWYDGRRDLVVSTQAALNYLEVLYRRFDGDWLLALAAYNAGGGKINSLIRRNRKKGLPTDFWNLDLPKETRSYVPKILALAEIIRRPRHYGVTLHEIRNESAFEVVYAPAQLDLVAAAELADIPLSELFYLNAGHLRWATEPNGSHNQLLLPKDRVANFKKVLAMPQSPAYGRWARHTVRPGDTVSEIAAQYQSTVAIVETTNQLRKPLQPGQKLLVPAATKPLLEEPLLALEHIKQSRYARTLRKRTGHTVKAGESLSMVAKQYNVQTRDLARWNGIRPHETLHTGRRLTVWKPAKPKTVGKLVRYTVKPGDSLYLIGRRHNVKVTDLRRWNKLDNQRYIKPGQRLRLFVNG